jgi:hypothetical protein
MLGYEKSSSIWWCFFTTCQSSQMHNQKRTARNSRFEQPPSIQYHRSGVVRDVIVIDKEKFKLIRSGIRGHPSEPGRFAPRSSLRQRPLTRHALSSLRGGCHATSYHRLSSRLPSTCLRVGLDSGVQKQYLPHKALYCQPL